MIKEILLGGNNHYIDVPFPFTAGDYNAYVIVLPRAGSDNITGLMVEALRADGTVITDIGEVSESRCKYTIKNSMYAVPGDVRIRVVPFSTDGQLTNYELIVQAIAAFDGASEVPADKAPALAQAITSANASGSFALEQGKYAAAQGEYAKGVVNTKLDKLNPHAIDTLTIEDSTAPYHNTKISPYGTIRRADLPGNELAIYPDMNTKKWMLEVAEASLPARRGAIYSEINNPPSDAAAVQLDVLNNDKLDMLRSKKAIFLNSSPQPISIINVKAGDEGTVFAKPGSAPLILPSNSKKSTNFANDSAGGPLLYHFFYDGTTFWWSCDKYNA